MVEAVTPVTTCRVCGATDWRNIISLGSMPLANSYVDVDVRPEDEEKYALEIMRCRRCFLVSVGHVVDPAILYRNYLYYSSDALMVTSHMHRVVSLCLNEFDMAPNDLVVELGSNTGTQLKLFRDAGMRVLGVDPAINLRAIAEGHGVPTLPEFFSAEVAAKIAADHGDAGLILGRHVFAHIDELSDTLAGVRNLLSSDGLFVIEVPYLLELLRKNQFDTIYHEHLSYFSVSTLRELFVRHGLKIVDVKHMDVHGGSILVFASLEGSKWNAREGVFEALESEEHFGLRRDETYQSFATRVDETNRELRDLIHSISKEGKTIAGYGAPAKGNTLLNFCGISKREVAFCTDTTEAKQGKLLPGTGIPIVPPQHGVDNPPDYYLLLAWNYAEEIVEKELAYLAAGGQFIVPIPKVKTISRKGLVSRYFD